MAPSLHVRRILTQSLIVRRLMPKICGLVSASWAKAIVSSYRNVVTSSQWSSGCCGLALRAVVPGSNSYETTSFAGLDETHSELHKDRLRQRTTGVMSQQVLQQVIPIPQLAITMPWA